MIEEVTLKSLAIKLQTSVDILIKQFADAGIQKQDNDNVTQEEKEILLLHLNRDNLNDYKEITFKRKIKSTLNIVNSGGKNKSIKIEIRKKQTYLKHHSILKKDKSFLQKSNTLNDKIKNINFIKEEKINQKNINNINEKKILEFELQKLKIKSEEESRIKLEKEVKRIAKEARKMAEKNNNWRKISNNNIDDNKYDYHSTTYQQARNAEDENDIKIEHDRHIKSIKINKNKKNVKQSALKSFREESKFFSLKNKKQKKKDNKNSLKQIFYKPTTTINRDIIIGETITVAELAKKMAIKSSQIIKSMMQMGFIATINQLIDQDTAQLIAEEMGHKVILRKENQLEESVMNDRDISSKLKKRAPIVTIMGHVDHGKTSLLDYIRSSKITLKEHGGITQHIGAYHIKTKKNNIGITFLDTPGHEAFTSMRSRGVKTTDIVVLIVAADDGIMQQTIEAIQHAQLAKVPIIVAINKIDKNTSNIKKIKNSLSQYNIISEEWGGENIFVEISATLGIGVNNLIKSIILQSEILDLKARKYGMASGIVLESYIDKGRGPVANILISEGILNKGDIVLCGIEYGKIRTIQNDLGIEIKSAEPSQPVKIFGLSGIPIVGDTFNVVRNEKKAREVSFYRKNKKRENFLYHQKKNNLSNMYSNMSIKDNVNEINIILKTDVQGSLEAISNALLNLKNDENKIKIIYSGIGSITETDIILASSSNAIILAFNVKNNSSIKKNIDTLNLDVRYYSVIYNLIKDIKNIIYSVSNKKIIPNNIGIAEVINIFKSKKIGTIAGCIVTEGIIRKNKNHSIEIIRNIKNIYSGQIDSLRRFKDDINEVKKGMECGIGVKNFHDIKKGDIIKLYENSIK